MSQKLLDAGMNRIPYEMPAPSNLTNELAPAPAPKLQAPSITEHTTHHLKS
jgi:hypothetical protein